MSLFILLSFPPGIKLAIIIILLERLYFSSSRIYNYREKIENRWIEHRFERTIVYFPPPRVSNFIYYDRFHNIRYYFLVCLWIFGGTGFMLFVAKGCLLKLVQFLKSIFTVFPADKIYLLQLKTRKFSNVTAKCFVIYVCVGYLNLL